MSSKPLIIWTEGKKQILLGIEFQVNVEGCAYSPPPTHPPSPRIGEGG